MSSVKRILTLITLILICFKSYGQFKTAIGPDGKPIYLIQKQDLNYNNGICGYINNLLSPYGNSNISSVYGNVLNGNFVFEANHFIQSKATITDILQECALVRNAAEDGHYIAFNNNIFEQPFVVSGLSGNLQLSGNRTPYLFFSGAGMGTIVCTSNHIDAIVQIKQSKYQRVEMNTNIFKNDTARFHIISSTIDHFMLTANVAKVLRLDMYTDTLGTVDVDDNWGDKTAPMSRISELNFYHCQFTGSVATIIRQNKRKPSIRFYDCVFSKDVQLTNLNADTIEFDRCKDIVKDMALSAERNDRPTVLKFRHTDLSHIDFDYDQRYVLYQWPERETIRGIYEQLLVKFQNEKKLESYERVDKEYFRFRHSWLINAISYCWWDYGYNKWLIILWTVFFVFIFSALNYRFWDRCVETYPIKKVSEISSTHAGVQKFIKILVYTSFIFFSIKIEFEKLSFKKTGWLAYFFLQYLLGLICLFFIANAILKL